MVSASAHDATKASTSPAIIACLRIYAVQLLRHCEERQLDCVASLAMTSLCASTAVGWAKARLRAVPTMLVVREEVGTLHFAHPTSPRTTDATSPRPCPCRS